DRVPKKYAGLDGTELAISESQERMAIVVDPKDVDEMMKYAGEENLEAVVAAEVTEDPRLVMLWRDKEIVNISRKFLNTNGAHQEMTAVITMPDEKAPYVSKCDKVDDVKTKWLETLADLNVCSKKGLVEMFDSSIGAATVTMPYGGKYQSTPIQTMTCKLPVDGGESDTVTMMSYGFDPYLSSWSPYHGAMYAVVNSVAKIVAAGGDHKKIRFTFQEFFKRLKEDPKRWGDPLKALLGAYEAQLRFGLPSIGGKDSMSGSFNEIDVPPTLVSFAVDTAKTKDVISPEFKKAGNEIYLFDIEKDEYGLPVFDKMQAMYERIHELITEGKIVSAFALGGYGVAEGVAKMAFGNDLGAEVSLSAEELFAARYGAIIVEANCSLNEGVKAGKVIAESSLKAAGACISLKEAYECYTKTLEKVYPTKTEETECPYEDKVFDAKTVYTAKNKVARPKVFIPVFPGTNCEYDSAKAFKKAGADVVSVVFRNLTASDIELSVKEYVKAINESQMIMFPGGFSAGDEPDGSAKFIASAFRNPEIAEAVNRLLKERDGLALGICNGFQALVKLGLVTYGEITNITADSPTLTTNTIGRHQSKSVYTKIVTNKSPWLMKAELGKVYSIPASHGEGRFVANKEWLDKLFANGQVATRYVDADGKPTMDVNYNINGSYAAIEGITSPDGRVLGKMAHSERIGKSVAINICGEQDQHIFESGVAYYK
ncbi:MAG: phosphoribosylformylglycinamidine synthase subunit PurQ, partial [Lachnospiraceae bacterium]|nr:phosphoribosylformylglycinamidine synthase subunit PurQ [Lachnospiraceae bacterium]